MDRDDRLDDERVRPRSGPDAEIQIEPARREVQHSESAVHLFADRLERLDAAQPRVVLGAERQRVGERPRCLRAGLELRMKTFVERKGNDRVQPQPEPSRSRLQDGAQLSTPTRRLIIRVDSGQLAVQRQPQPAERRLEQAPFEAQLRARVVVGPVRAQRRLQVHARLEKLRETEVRLQREVRDVARRQLSRGRCFRRPVKEFVDVDLDARGHRRRRFRVVDLDLERILRPGSRGAQQHGETDAHGRGTLRRNERLRRESDPGEVLMAAKRYVIVGAGMTAHAAAQGIRELDQQGTITMLGGEPHPPYARPPLSKALWKGQAEDSVWLAPVAELKLLSSRRAMSIDRNGHRVIDDRGESHPYDKLLLATGGTPRRLPYGGDRVVYFRTVDDYRRLRRSGRRAAVIGGGFIGSEIAAALSMDGREVTMIFPEAGICARAFPSDLSAFVTGYYRDKGVQVLTGDVPADVTGSGAVRTRSGREVAADVIVAGLGIVPETRLAEAAGLAVRDGIVVDEQLRTNDPDILAAGDVARFHSAVL